MAGFVNVCGPIVADTVYADGRLVARDMDFYGQSCRRLAGAGRVPPGPAARSAVSGWRARPGMLYRLTISMVNLSNGPLFSPGIYPASPWIWPSIASSASALSWSRSTQR